jgi:membrane-associated phospholipid phosphatase
MRTLGLSVVLVGGLLVSPAWADPPAPGASPYVDTTFRYDLRVDLPITGVGLAAWIATEVAKPQLAPSSCRVCERAADGTDQLNGFDAGVRSLLRANSAQVPARLSDVTAFGLTPVLMIGLGALANYSQGSPKQGLVDLLMVAESTVLAVDLNQLVKFAVGRERPFVHVLPDSEKTQVANAADNNLSFYSGHTTLAFALATSAGTVASLRHYRLAPLIWALGMPLATLAGLLRISADRHYATDVLTGMAVGSAMGFLGPWLHRKQGPSAAVYPVVMSSRQSGPNGTSGVMVGLGLQGTAP